MCVKTTSSSSIISGTPVYKKTTQTEYKWSRETALNGWTRTGKTREVTVRPGELVVDNSFKK